MEVQENPKVDEETKHLFRKAVEEIRSLRRQNELLSARTEMFDAVMCLLHTKPAVQTQGMGLDVVAEIEHKLYQWRDLR